MASLKARQVNTSAVGYIYDPYPAASASEDLYALRFFAQAGNGQLTIISGQKNRIALVTGKALKPELSRS